VAKDAEAEFLDRTTAKPKTRRRVEIVNHGIVQRFQTVKTDDEIQAHFAPTPEDRPEAAAPGFADFGEDPFERKVREAVAAHLKALGLGGPNIPANLRAQPIAVSHHVTGGYPVGRKTNQHVRLATDVTWSEPTDGSKPLSSRIERYMRYIKARDLVYSYMMEHETAFDILLAVVGDKPCMDVSVDDMDDVVATIGALPAHWAKKPEYRDLSLLDVVAKAQRLESPKLMLTSQQRAVTVLRTFFIWLETRGEARPGLLLGVRLFQADRDFGGQRDWFDPEELSVLLDPKKDARFYAPWQTWLLRLGLFAGMRQREIIQLETSDIQNVDGIWCIDITGDGKNKRVKNKCSRRKVPIHDMLIKAGFLEYVDQARKAGVTRLFPDLAMRKTGLGKKATNWFTIFVRQTCKIEARTKTFHSLRHSFATLAERSELRDEHIMKLLGHSWGNTVLRTVYTQELDLREKHTLLHRINFPAIKMSPHRDDRYERYFRIAYADQTRKARIDAAYGVAPSRANPRLV
jgi:integrase